MGKGFLANKGLIGQDLGEIVKTACKRQGFDVQVEAILNDSSACLLSQAYTHTSTRFGLILGTGFNIGAYLPVPIIGRRKFGSRPVGWFDRASHVIVNTEMSMFGKNILPVTRWDRLLLDALPRPDFQPLEFMVSGMYLGEVARHALIEGIETTGIFGGVLPSSLNTPYSLGTETLSMIERLVLPHETTGPLSLLTFRSDNSDGLSEARKIFAERHPSTHTPTTSDLFFLRSLASFISLRSSALVATCVYTLSQVRLESDKAYVSKLPESSPLRKNAECELNLEKTTVAFNGSVIEHYPNYLENCQRYADELVAGRDSPGMGGIELVPAKESSLLGAAVASACVKADS